MAADTGVPENTTASSGAVWVCTEQSVVRPREATTLAIADRECGHLHDLLADRAGQDTVAPQLPPDPARPVPAERRTPQPQRRPGTDSAQRCPTAGQALEPRAAPPASGLGVWPSGTAMSDRPADKVWCRSPDVAFVDDGEQLLDLRDPANSRPQLLTGTAAAIWRVIDESRPTAHIVGAVSSGPAGNAEEDVERDVVAFLKVLTGRAWLSLSQSLCVDDSGLDLPAVNLVVDGTWLPVGRRSSTRSAAEWRRSRPARRSEPAAALRHRRRLRWMIMRTSTLADAVRCWRTSA